MSCLVSEQIPKQKVIGCKILKKQVKLMSRFLVLQWIGMCVLVAEQASCHAGQANDNHQCDQKRTVNMYAC